MERVLRTGGSPAPRQVYLNAEPARNLLKDIPWRIVGSSILLALLCLVGLLLIGRNLPQDLISSEPQPVEVAVRLFEEVPKISPPDVTGLPAQPPEERIEIVLDDPPPVPEEPPVTPPPVPERMTAEPPKSPETVRIQPPPADLSIPSPSSLRPTPSERPQERPFPPEQKAPVISRQEATLPKPSRADYEGRTAPEAARLPERNTALKKEDASSGLGAGPHTSRAAERGTVQKALPRTPSIALKSSVGTDLGGAAPRMNSRYSNLSDSPNAPLPDPKGAVVLNGGEERGMLPKATAFAAPDSRKMVAMLPPADRSDSSFGGAGREADSSLPGPAARAASLPQDRSDANAPGKSFEFLDLVGPEDLDRTVMVNLNQLQTCLDPEEELTLKTRLAAMLSGPAQCRSGGVVFDIRQPESAYSIHVDLYNYEQREFQDRCSALRLAVNSCEVRR